MQIDMQYTSCIDVSICRLYALQVLTYRSICSAHWCRSIHDLYCSIYFDRRSIRNTHRLSICIISISAYRYTCADINICRSNCVSICRSYAPQVLTCRLQINLQRISIWYAIHIAYRSAPWYTYQYISISADQYTCSGINTSADNRTVYRSADFYAPQVSSICTTHRAVPIDLHLDKQINQSILICRPIDTHLHLCIGPCQPETATGLIPSIWYLGRESDNIR